MSANWLLTMPTLVYVYAETLIYVYLHWVSMVGLHLRLGRCRFWSYGFSPVASAHSCLLSCLRTATFFHCPLWSNPADLTNSLRASRCGFQQSASTYAREFCSISIGSVAATEPSVWHDLQSWPDCRSKCLASALSQMVPSVADTDFQYESDCRRPERSWIPGLLVEVQSVDSTKARTRKSTVSGGVACLQCTVLPDAVKVPLSMWLCITVLSRGCYQWRAACRGETA